MKRTGKTEIFAGLHPDTAQIKKSPQEGRSLPAGGVIKYIRRMIYPGIFDIPIVLSAGSICICRKRNQTLKTGTSHEYNPLAEKPYFMRYQHQN